jgi:DNA polymerase I
MLAPVFDWIHLVDTEYQVGMGDRVRPICLVSRELYSGAVHRRWLWDCDPGAPPWDPDDPRTLVVCFSATAECSVFAALGWPQPRRLLDLWAEYRVLTNGVTNATKLLDVLAAYGITAPIETAEKKAWQKLCAEGSPEEIATNREGILVYCEGDVDPLVELYRLMVG